MGHCMAAAHGPCGRAPLAPGHSVGYLWMRWPLGAQGGLLGLELTPVLLCSPREALLAEMGVAMREDGGTLGVFSPKKVGVRPASMGLPRLGHGWAPCPSRGLIPLGEEEQGGGSRHWGPRLPQPGPPCLQDPAPLPHCGCPHGLGTAGGSFSCLRSRLGPSRSG